MVDENNTKNYLGSPSLCCVILLVGLSAIQMGSAHNPAAYEIYS